MDTLTLITLAAHQPRAAVMNEVLHEGWYHATHCAECALRVFTRATWRTAAIKDEHVCRWCGELLEVSTWTYSP